MDTNGFIFTILLCILVSNTCNASLGFNHRKLVTTQSTNASANPQASPIGSPVSPLKNESNTTPINEGNSEKMNISGSSFSNVSNSNTSTYDNKTLPIDSKENDNHNKTAGALAPPSGEKNVSQLDHGEGKVVSASPPPFGDNGNCEGSLSFCKDKEMNACIKTLGGGSKEMLLMVLNGGESTLNININFPNSLGKSLATFKVPKHETHKVYISPTMVKSNELVVNSNNGTCVLPSVHPLSGYFAQELSYYYKQVTPTYAAYAFFILALLFGGSWACCQLRKRSRQDVIQYQELEMGLPESSSAVNVDAAEGWDDNWDVDDDWDEDNSVKSPGGHVVRNISVDGLTARSSKKDGWDDDWDD